VIEFDYQLPPNTNITPSSLTVTVGANVYDTVTATFDANGDRQIQTISTTTRVGAVRSFSGRLTGSMVLPAAVNPADLTAVVLGFESNNPQVYGPINMGLILTGFPCRPDNNAVPCELRQAYVDICTVAICDGDKPALYITAPGGTEELLGYFDADTLELLVTNPDYIRSATGYIQEAGGAASLCGNQKIANRVWLGFTPGIDCGTVIRYVNGTESKSLTSVQPVCTFQTLVTGVNVASAIQITGLAIDGYDYGTVAITATAGTLDVQWASIAVALTTLTGLTWTYTAGTDILSIRGAFKSLVLTGLDGAGAPLSNVVRTLTVLAGSCSN
jgi:hypothetical protein